MSGETISAETISVSLQQSDDDLLGMTSDDKIECFAYRVWHLPAMGRWGRTLQFVK